MSRDPSRSGLPVYVPGKGLIHHVHDYGSETVPTEAIDIDLRLKDLPELGDYDSWQSAHEAVVHNRASGFKNGVDDGQGDYDFFTEANGYIAQVKDEITYMFKSSEHGYWPWTVPKGRHVLVNFNTPPCPNEKCTCPNHERFTNTRLAILVPTDSAIKPSVQLIADKSV